MLTQKEHDAMIMFDRLLMAADENETISDLLDQTLNVARMIDPRADEKIIYGPLQRMHFEWQQAKYRLDSLEKKLDHYLNNQNRYGGIYSSTGNQYRCGTGTGYATSGVGTWPSNPGFGDIGMNEYVQNPLSSTEIKSIINHMNNSTSAINTADPKQDAK